MNNNSVTTSSRLKRLQRKMDKSGLDSFLVLHLPNVFYLSGFSGSNGYLLITMKKSYLITDFRYIEQAKAEAPGFYLIQLQSSMSDTIGHLLPALQTKNLGFESDYVNFSTYQSLRDVLPPEFNLIPTKTLVEKLRAIKDESELTLIKQAVSITDQAFKQVLPLIKPGISENEISLEIEYFMRKAGAQGRSFDFIVASGKRSALPHGVASTKRLMSGDLVTIDIGAIYQGYCADMTRTIALGPVEARKRKIYNIVRDAQETALNEVKSGMGGVEADRIARSIIEQAGYSDYFGHGLGHGVGLEVHEFPTLSPKSKDTLYQGMVVTIEPGIYIPDWGGIRIEDMIYISKNEVQLLTKSSKDFIVI